MESHQTQKTAPNWRRRFWIVLVLWSSVTIATSFKPVRGLMISPLCVNEGNARAQAAYVMADGNAYWERLHAASDLYHMHRVKQIYVLEELNTGPYNFVRHTNDTLVRRAIDYLVNLGVPEEAVRKVPQLNDDWMSSRQEARAVHAIEGHPESLIVVTSPPHTRRAKLCFQRTFGADAEISVVSACDPAASVETHHPIWIEYAKLFVYWCCA